jgi:hypothetical protein
MLLSNLCKTFSTMCGKNMLFIDYQLNKTYINFLLKLISLNYFLQLRDDSFKNHHR